VNRLEFTKFENLLAKYISSAPWTVVENGDRLLVNSEQCSRSLQLVVELDKIDRSCFSASVYTIFSLIWRMSIVDLVGADTCSEITIRSSIFWSIFPLTHHRLDWFLVFVFGSGGQTPVALKNKHEKRIVRTFFSIYAKYELIWVNCKKASFVQTKSIPSLLPMNFFHQNFGKQYFEIIHY